MRTADSSTFPQSTAFSNLITFPFSRAVVGVHGCDPSLSMPGISQERQAIEERIKNDSGELMKLVSFKKTNGQAFAVIGINGSSMENKVEVEFLDACLWPFDFRALRIVGLGRPSRKGERATISRNLRCEKSERG